VDYYNLLNTWLKESNLPVSDDPGQESQHIKDLRTTIQEMLKEDTPLMQRRALGPAIVKDMVSYIGQRFGDDRREEELLPLLGEAFLLYAMPQLDGLDHDAILEVYRHLNELFDKVETKDKILARIRAFYLHIRLKDWETALAVHSGESESASG
jgi:hypothetical protein